MSDHKKTTYRDAGVDIDAGNRFVQLIKPLVKATSRPEVLTDIGGFGGLFSLNTEKYRKPFEPLIGNVTARGRTTTALAGAIASRLNAEFVRDPEVTVDIHQHRPFFILGEVKNAGQYPYVPGMTIETAIASAGGYSDRASTRSYRLSRRIDGFVERMEVPGDYVVKAGDTVFVYERFF